MELALFGLWAPAWMYMFASAKGKQKKQVRLRQCQEQGIDHILYYLSRLSGARFFLQPFLKQL